MYVCVYRAYSLVSRLKIKLGAHSYCSYAYIYKSAQEQFFIKYRLPREITIVILPEESFANICFLLDRETRSYVYAYYIRMYTCIIINRYAYAHMAMCIYLSFLSQKDSKCHITINISK